MLMIYIDITNRASIFLSFLKYIKIYFFSDVNIFSRAFCLSLFVESWENPEDAKPKPGDKKIAMLKRENDKLKKQVKKLNADSRKEAVVCDALYIYISRSRLLSFPISWIDRSIYCALG